MVRKGNKKHLQKLTIPTACSVQRSMATRPQKGGSRAPPVSHGRMTFVQGSSQMMTITFVIFVCEKTDYILRIIYWVQLLFFVFLM